MTRVNDSLVNHLGGSFLSITELSPKKRRRHISTSTALFSRPVKLRRGENQVLRLIEHTQEVRRVQLAWVVPADVSRVAKKRSTSRSIWHRKSLDNFLLGIRRGKGCSKPVRSLDCPHCRLQVAKSKLTSNSQWGIARNPPPSGVNSGFRL